MRAKWVGRNEKEREKEKKKRNIEYRDDDVRHDDDAFMCYQNASRCM